MSRFFGEITKSEDYNVNLGKVVTVNSATCSIGENPVVYSSRLGEIWIYGILLPPTSGSFPDVISELFSVPVPSSFSNRGWISVYGTLTNLPDAVTPFLLEYTYSNGKAVFRNFASSGTYRLSAMQKLYIPAVRICAFY